MNKTKKSTDSCLMHNQFDILERKQLKWELINQTNTLVKNAD